MTFRTFQKLGLRSAASIAVMGALLGMPLSAHANSQCGADYTISGGDTLGKIAKRCGVSVAGIVKANAGIRPNSIRIGQRIVLPGGATEGDGQDQDQETTESVSYEGRIINGRWCALLETANGEVFGLRSREIAFASDRFVAVEGKLVEGQCGKDRTIMVTGLEMASN